MKKDMVAWILLFLILGVGIYEDIFFNKTIDILDEFTSNIEIEIQKENVESSIVMCENTAQMWEDKNKFFEIVFYNPNIKNVSLDLYEILGALKIEDTKSALARVYVLRERLNNLRETMSFSVISII